MIDSSLEQREQFVSSNPKVLGGVLVFSGTRVPAQSLLDYLHDGFTLDQFLEFFPSVPRPAAEQFLRTIDRAVA